MRFPCKLAHETVKVVPRILGISDQRALTWGYLFELSFILHKVAKLKLKRAGHAYMQGGGPIFFCVKAKLNVNMQLSCALASS